LSPSLWFTQYFCRQLRVSNLHMWFCRWLWCLVHVILGN
jgi:hypothetical protein